MTIINENKAFHNNRRNKNKCSSIDTTTIQSVIQSLTIFRTLMLWKILKGWKKNTVIIIAMFLRMHLLT